MSPTRPMIVRTHALADEGLPADALDPLDDVRDVLVRRVGGHDHDHAENVVVPVSVQGRPRRRGPDMQNAPRVAGGVWVVWRLPTSDGLHGCSRQVSKEIGRRHGTSVGERRSPVGALPGIRTRCRPPAGVLSVDRRNSRLDDQASSSSMSFIGRPMKLIAASAELTPRCAGPRPRACGAAAARRPASRSAPSRRRATIRAVSDSPPSRTAKNAANTGSMLITIAVRVGDRWACAQVCPSIASAPAKTAM